MTYRLPILSGGNPTYTGSGSSQTPVYDSGDPLPTQAVGGLYYGNVEVAAFITAQQNARIAIYSDSLFSGSTARLLNGIYRTWPVTLSSWYHQPLTAGAQAAYTSLGSAAFTTNSNSDSGWCQDTNLATSADGYATVNDIYTNESITASDLPFRYLWKDIGTSSTPAFSGYFLNADQNPPDADPQDSCGLYDWDAPQDGTRLRAMVPILQGTATGPTIVRALIRAYNSGGSTATDQTDYTLADIDGIDSVDLTGSLAIKAVRSPVLASHPSNNDFYPAFQLAEASAGAFSGKTIIAWGTLFERFTSDELKEEGIGINIVADASGRNPEVYIGGATPTNVAWNNHGSTRLIRQAMWRFYGNPNVLFYNFGLNPGARYNSTFADDYFDLLYQHARDFWDAYGFYPYQVIHAPYYASNMDETRHTQLGGMVKAARETFNDNVLMLSSFNRYGGESFTGAAGTGNYLTDTTFALDGDGDPAGSGVHPASQADAQVVSYGIWSMLQQAATAAALSGSGRSRER